MHLRSTFLIRPLFPLKAFFCDFYQGTKKMLKKRAKHAKVDSLFFSFSIPIVMGYCVLVHSWYKSLLVCEAFFSSKPSILIPRLMAFLCSDFLGPEILSKEKNANLWEMSSSSSTPPDSQCLKVTKNMSHLNCTKIYYRKRTYSLWRILGLFLWSLKIRIKVTPL